MPLRNNENEIVALLRLMDDPDMDVFEAVALKLLSYGSAIIPKLEALWEVTDSSLARERLENLVHRSLYLQLQNELLTWTKNENPSLLEAAFIISKFRYPELDKELLLHQFELLRRNVWLEMNNYLSPLEQINIINSILYNFFKLQGHELTVGDPNLFFIKHTLESRQGNAITIGILYVALCEMLDVPIFAIDIPHQFIIAYFDNLYSFDDIDKKNAIKRIQFFIDPTNGVVFNKDEILMYLKKTGKNISDKALQPLNNKEIVVLLLENLAITYDNIGETDRAAEIENLIPLIQLTIV